MTDEGFVYNRVFESAEEMTEWLQLVADAPMLEQGQENLRAEVETVERQRNAAEAENSHWREEAVSQQERYLAEKARAEEAEAKAKVLERNGEHLSALLEARQNDAFEAEARVAEQYELLCEAIRRGERYERALREIAESTADAEDYDGPQNIARRALGEEV